MNWIWDELDSKIIWLIRDKYNQSGIIKATGAPGKTVRYRLKRLIERKYITECEQAVGGTQQKIFILTGKGVKTFLQNGTGKSDTVEIGIGNETVPCKIKTKDVPKVTWHAVSYIAPILDKTKSLPLAKKYYTPNGAKKPWTVYDDIDGKGRYTIRLTSKSAIIDVNVEIPADTRENTAAKYSELANSLLLGWSERYKYPLGKATLNRKHQAIAGSGKLASLMGGGELYLPGLGLKKDNSDKEHNGELESVNDLGEQSMDKFLRSVMELPEFKNEMKVLFTEQNKEQGAQIQTVLEELRKEMLTLAAVQKIHYENTKLRAENLEKQIQLDNLSQQVNEMRGMLDQLKQSVGQPQTTNVTDQESDLRKRGYDQYYGYG